MEEGSLADGLERREGVELSLVEVLGRERVTWGWIEVDRIWN